MRVLQGGAGPLSPGGDNSRRSSGPAGRVGSAGRTLGTSATTASSGVRVVVTELFPEEVLPAPQGGSGGFLFVGAPCGLSHEPHELLEFNELFLGNSGFEPFFGKCRVRDVQRIGEFADLLRHLLEN